MRGRIFQVVVLLVYGVVLLALLGATLPQGIPPSPAIYVGVATVDGQPAPEGTTLVACRRQLGLCSRPIPSSHPALTQ